MINIAKPFISFSGLGFTKKLFMWSVLLEPMLHFIFYYGTIFFVSGNLSKMLQTFLFICVFFRFWVYYISQQKYQINFSQFNSPTYYFLGIYFLYTFISLLVGFGLGMYSLELSFDQSNDFPHGSFQGGVSNKIIGSYFIFLYYILLFTVFTVSFLDNKEALNYFFRLFKIIFLITIITGYVDFFVYALTGIDLIARHFFDGVGVGARFHGFAGEPRQAAVYLMFSLAVLHLECIFTRTKFKNFYYLLIAPAFLLTMSVTGILMLAIFFGLSSLYFLRDIFSKRTLIFFVSSTLTIIAGYFFVTSIERFQDYIKAFDDLFFLLDSGAELPLLIRVQIGEIAPVFEMFSMARDGNFLPVIFGSGLGSVPVTLYGFLGNMDGWGNPNSQIIRILFETGLLGLLVYCLAFIYPIKFLTSHLSDQESRIIYLSMMLVLAANLALRSSTLLIYFGLLIATMTIMQKHSHSSK